MSDYRRERKATCPQCGELIDLADIPKSDVWPFSHGIIYHRCGAQLFVHADATAELKQSDYAPDLDSFSPDTVQQSHPATLAGHQPRPHEKGHEETFEGILLSAMPRPTAARRYG